MFDPATAMPPLPAVGGLYRGQTTRILPFHYRFMTTSRIPNFWCAGRCRSYPSRRDEPIKREGDDVARLPSITGKEQVPAKDHATFDSIVASRGAVQGPFTMWLHSPEVAERVAHLGAYVRFEGSLDMRVRVLAAMTVAREFEAGFFWGAPTGGGPPAPRAGGGDPPEPGEPFRGPPAGEP